MIKNRFRNIVKSVKSGFVRRKPVRENNKKRISLEKLKDPKVKVKVSEMIENMLEPIDKTAEFHIDNVWNNFKNSINDILQMNLKRKDQQKNRDG
ncbi:hypothetical protein HHI36_000980 [Cryptolaemus montrouzieri]|uniref:Uncharacterized protein n=1 Tax=Cryptolaemus montrouzieri TaxID=559131 RepID=A0ABD2P642_9CUCU